jgi:hypothetical protein
MLGWLDRVKDVLSRMDTPRINERVWQWYRVYVYKHITRAEQQQAAGYFSRPHATTYCSYANCKRHVAFAARGYLRLPIDWRTQNVFAFGHITEAWAKAILNTALRDRLYDAGAHDLPGWIVNGHQVKVQPDALIDLTHTERKLIQDADERRRFPDPVIAIEIKSISTNGFDTWQRTGINSKPGYYDQAQLEMYGTGAMACLFFTFCKNDGRMLMETVWRDHERILELCDLFTDTCVLPPNNFDPAHGPVAQYEFFRGSKKGKVEAEKVANGRPITARTGETGRISGWNLEIGKVLPWQCRYCDFRVQCYSMNGYTLREDITDKNEFVIWCEKEDKEDEPGTIRGDATPEGGIGHTEHDPFSF